MTCTEDVGIICNVHNICLLSWPSCMHNLYTSTLRSLSSRTLTGKLLSNASSPRNLERRKTCNSVSPTEEFDYSCNATASRLIILTGSRWCHPVHHDKMTVSVNHRSIHCAGIHSDLPHIGLAFCQICARSCFLIWALPLILSLLLDKMQAKLMRPRSGPPEPSW